MSCPRRVWMIAFSAVAIVAMILACSLPIPGRTTPEETVPAEEEDGEETSPPVVEPVVPVEPLVVTHQEPMFNIYSLEGVLVETRSAAGMSWARPNTVQVVGDAIYYVDSAGSSLSGVVRRVTSAGTESLDFTAADTMATLTFAVSADGSQIAWTHSTWTDRVVSSLWMANIDGSDERLVLESGPDTQPEEYYALEVVGWTTDGDLIYAWQISGIGGYILFFGYSSLYRYSPASGMTTELVPVGPNTGAPCWSATSSDGAYAVGACGAVGGVVERDLGTGVETGFPTFHDQGQAGAGAYSPSENRLAYGIARGSPEDENGQVIVRMSRGEDPASIATQASGYFERISWIDDARMVVGYTAGENAQVDLMRVDGTRSLVGDGRLIGVMWPAAEAAVGAREGLAGQVDRGDLTVVDITANGDIAGPGIEVVVRNLGAADVQATIPCGFVFTPGSPADQRLMVVQEVSATVPAGGEATLTVFVICIDPTSSTPDDGAGYALGGMESGDLLRLAQCACNEELDVDSMEGLELMLAGWSLRAESLGAELGEEAEGAVGDLFGEDSGAMLGGLLESLGGMGGEWLERCGIEAPQTPEP